MAEEKKVASRAKTTRTVKPVYAIMSVQDANGNTVALTKENVTIHAVEKSADAVLEAMDAGTLPAGSFYKRISLG
jgi:flagellar basal body rod protein FlgB